MSKRVGKLIFVGFLFFTQIASAFYDGSLGRWLNRDPAHEVGGINLYTFTHNDSVNAYDTDGRYVSTGAAVGYSIGTAIAGTAIGVAASDALLNWLYPDPDPSPLPLPPKRPKPKPGKDPRCQVDYDPTIPDHRDDLRDCFRQAFDFDQHLIKTGREPMSDQEFEDYVSTCMKGKNYNFPP